MTIDSEVVLLSSGEVVGMVSEGCSSRSRFPVALVQHRGSQIELMHRIWSGMATKDEKGESLSFGAHR